MEGQKTLIEGTNREFSFLLEFQCVNEKERCIFEIQCVPFEICMVTFNWETEN